MHAEIERTESYQIGTDCFLKEYLKNGQIRLKKNGTTISLSTWNREINRFQSMELKEKHPNALVRWIEENRRKGFLDFVDAGPKEIVADVGAESGYLSARLVERGCRVACLDIDPNLLKAAQKHIGQEAVWYVSSDIRQISIPSATFDVTIASEILEHLPDPLEGLRELVRITRPGGRIFLSIPNDRLILSVKKILHALHLTKTLGQLSSGVAIGHLHTFDKNDLNNLCLKTNVIVENIYYHKPVYLNVFARLRKVAA